MNASATATTELEAIARRMAGCLVHRGPDDAGSWVDQARGLGFGFRRLAIVDLSEAGRQPMFSSSGRYVVVFNGEIYNHAELRPVLEGCGHNFRGGSDTEVLLAAVEAWGLEAALRKFVGMFAFVIWDCHNRVLHLVRDRLGVKPLYYGWAGKTLIFASELKALRAYPEWAPEISRDALALHMRYGYIPQPHSIYKGICKLPPATILSVRGDCPFAGNSVPKPYWSAREVAERGAADPLRGSESEIIEQLDSVLRDAVRVRLRSDVPVGAFLSGGIDSSTVVALMQAQSASPVRTFTIGLEDRRYNEAEDARAVAQHLGTMHTEHYVTVREAQSVVPKLPVLFDEPFSDSSQVPTYLVSLLARRQVTVNLSGDGGDVIFGGLNRYFWTRRIWRWTGWAPFPVRCAGAWVFDQVSPQAWDRLFARLSCCLPARLRVRLAGDKMRKVSHLLRSRSREDLYRRLVSLWVVPEAVLVDSREAMHVLAEPFPAPSASDFIQIMMLLDLLSYLPDDILTKVDRASMACGLESRAPFLDHRVVEFAGRLPLRLKVCRGTGKWVLRKVLHRYVPPRLVERPKMGFGIPLGEWLRDGLRDWAEPLLAGDRLRQDGYLKSEPVRHMWREHLSGRRNWESQLWPVLMFQAWREQWA